MLAVGNCCYVAVCSAARGASAPAGEGRGHIVAAAHLQLVYDRSSLRHWQEQHVVQYGTYLSYDMSRTSGLSREQRGLGRPKLAQR